MDKIINNHIDKVEELCAEFDADLDSLMQDIEIAGVIKDAQGTMLQVAADVKELFQEKYAVRAAELGINFAQMIQQKIEDEEKLKIDKSQDPKLND